jgi:hypothetical protein
VPEAWAVLEAAEAAFLAKDVAAPPVDEVCALNTTVLPLAIVWEAGWVAKPRGLAVFEALTVRVASELVTVPAALDAVTE